MKLGMVTYQMGKDMDLATLLRFCQDVGLEGVELRTTHAHGVEPDLGAGQRAEVRQRFADSPVALVGLGTTCEFHSNDPRVVKRNVEEAKRFAQLAADVGAGGIKLRPNGIPEGEAVEPVCERIATAWQEVAVAAADVGVETRMEVHGARTQEPAIFTAILRQADHPDAKVCWNSNPTDVDAQGSIGPFFDAVKHRLGLVHITDIGIPQYPWQDLFDRLNAIDYPGFCLAEIGYNSEPERFMLYYRTLYEMYTRRP